MIRLSMITILLIPILLSGCDYAEEPSKDIKDLSTDYFAGEWCLVKSTHKSNEGSPNTNYRFTSTKMLAFERMKGSGKFGSGSYHWKPEVNQFLLSTPPNLMRIAPVESATDNSFVLGGKIGYTFVRGVCEI